MINADNSVASFANSFDKPNGGFVKASVVRGPDDAGAFTLRLEGGREVSVVVEEGDAKAKMAPGQNVLINLSDGKIIVPDAAQGQQGRQPQQTPLAGQQPQTPQTLPAGLPQQSAQTLPADLPQNLPAGQPQQSQQSAQTLPAELPQNLPAGQPQQSTQSAQTLPAGLPPQSPQTPLTGQLPQSPQPAQTPVQPFVSINADVFIAGELVKQIRDGLESPLLRSLPAELIEKIASERGGIDVAALNALDAVLRNRSLPVDASSPLVLERLEQWLRLALDNPKLAEDLADRIPLLGAREIIDKFLQLNKLGANFLPDNLLQKLSAERLFLGNDAGVEIKTGINAENAPKNIAGNNLRNDAGTEIKTGINAENAPKNIAGNNLRNDAGAEIKTGINAENAPKNIIGNNLRNETGAEIKPGINAENAPKNITGNNLRNDAGAEIKTGINAGNASGDAPQTGVSPSGATIKELFAKAFSAAPAALLDLVKRIDSSEINANVKLPPEEARKIAGELLNRLPAQAAEKPELVHDMKQLPPRIAEAAAASPIIPNKPDLPNAHIIQNKQDLSTPIISNKADSFVTTIISNKSESPNAHIIPNKPESPAFIIPTKVDLPVTTIIPNKSESPNAHVIPNKPDLSTPVIPNKADSPVTTIIQNKSESPNAHIIPNKPDLSAPIILNKADSPVTTIIPNKPELPNAPPEPPKDARYPVPQNVYERIESAPRLNIPTENKNALFSQIGTAQEVIRSVIDGNARTADASEAAVKQAVSSDINTGNTANKPNAQFTQVASNPPAPPPLTSALPQSTPQTATIGEAVVKQAVSNDINTDISANKPNVLFTQVASNPPASPPLTSTLPQSTPPQPMPLPAQQPLPPQITTTNDAAVRQAPPDIVTQAARLLLDNTEKLRIGFQEAFSSLDLQSRVFPSDFSGGSESSAVRQSLDALRLETLLNASKALQDIFSIVEELRGAAELLSDKSREPAEAEKLLARAAENLARQARTCGGEIADRLSDALRELNRMQSDASKSDGGLPARQSPAEIMRSAALTAAGGLESLHLLASAARGQELQQQVVALPVKIGDEWTELQVKIIKERKGKEKKEKKEGGGHVSVYLNVAPSKLGEVTAHLDYHPPASLKLSFQFGKPEATKWFRERAAGLREALSAAGLPGAALEFHTRRQPVRAQNVENQDVKPVGAATANGLGSVDFRA